MAEATRRYAFHARINNRGSSEVSHDGHISIEDLRNALLDDTNVAQILRDFKSLGRDYELKIAEYLTNNIPTYPTPIEFHISEVTHVTDSNSFDKICESEGFRAHQQHVDDKKFLWWSLKIDEESLQAAEKRYLDTVFPNRSEEQIERQEPFLHMFTTSPAFDEKSRYGHFRFSFPLRDLMERYRVQKCGDQDPVLREYKTMFYKQEIMYVVLVHSPEDNEMFEEYKKIENSPFVDYTNNQIVWNAQAVGNAISSELILNEEDKIAEVKPVCGEFYVWDHVCLAFHLDDILQFPKETLINHCKECDLADNNIAKEKNYTRQRAKTKIDQLKESLKKS
ncbi:uncharacterized protein [Pseudorasbora parva]|uniref:uncharacterized protein n=1 Tax=Pseudorasbora parva TaxID=51549 RepID=UPI00351DF7D5